MKYKPAKLWICFYILWFLITKPITIFAQEPVSLRQAIQIAIENNPRMQVLSDQRAVAEAEIKIVGEINNPSFIVETTRSLPNYFFGAGYLFELGGKRGKREEIARAGANVSELETQSGLRALRYEVRLAFYGLLQSRSKQQEATISWNLAQRLLEIAKQRFDAGEVARLEVLSAQLALKQRENELEQSQAEEKAALFQLNSLWNRSPDQNIELAGSLEEVSQAPDLDTLMNQAMSKHLELLSLQEKIHGEEARLALARAERLPDLETEVGTEIHDSDFQYGWRAGLRVDLPLFNRKKGEIQRETAIMQGLKSQQEVVRQEIRTELSNTYLKYQATIYQTDNYRKEILPASTELGQLAEESYREGHTGILPVLEAQRSARQVRLEYLDVLLQLQISLANLELASGVELP